MKSGLLFESAGRELHRLEKKHGPLADADFIHDIRVLTKRVRAVLRLIERAGHRHVLTERRVARDASRKLRHYRDLDVLLDEVSQLSRKTRRSSDQKAALRLIHAARTDRDHESLDRQRDASEALNRLREMIRHESQVSSEIDDGQLLNALKKTFKRAHRAYMKARGKRKLAASHAWRKKIKDYQFQIEAVAAASRANAPASLKRFKKVASHLGDALDSHMIREKLEQAPLRARYFSKALKKSQHKNIKKAFRRETRLKFEMPL